MENKGVDLNSIDKKIIGQKIFKYDNNNNEFNLKNINKNIIDILNIFKRASCNKDENTFLNTNHLYEDHSINLDYDIITNLIYNNDNKKISEIYLKLKDLI